MRITILMCEFSFGAMQATSLQRVQDHVLTDVSFLRLDAPRQDPPNCARWRLFLQEIAADIAEAALCKYASNFYKARSVARMLAVCAHELPRDVVLTAKAQLPECTFVAAFSSSSLHAHVVPEHLASQWTSLPSGAQGIIL